MIKKNLGILLLLFVTLWCFSVSALSNDKYFSINDKDVAFSYNGLSFYGINFYLSKQTHSDGKTVAYPSIFGFVSNASGHAIEYTSDFSFYDKNYELIGNFSYTQKIEANIMGGLYQYQVDYKEIDKKYSVDDISYYKINILSHDESIRDYNINSYDINIIVNENNVLNINEEISAYFNVYKHGIFRKIPLRNNIVRLDGTSESNNATIRNIKVNERYSIYQEGIYKVIQIGDPNNTIIGPKDYHISYSYNLGKDKTNKYDELYFNLIGSEWDTAINNITFKITMPKSFDASKLGFSSGVPGSTDSSKITYQVDGNTITGSYNESLNPGEALTIRLELPEGYFKNFVFDIDINIFSLIAFIVCLLSLIITFILWKRANKNKIVETVEFYPPENINSVELALINKGKVSDNDIISLLITLANKGYLTISETTSNSLLRKKEFKITKLKEYYGGNEYEKMFFDGLFLYGDAVTEKDLRYKFYITIREIKKQINDKKNLEKVFEKKSLINEYIVMGLAILTMVMISIQTNPNIVSIEDLFSTVVSNLFSIIGFTVILYQLVATDPLSKKMPLIFFFAVWGGVPWLSFVLPLLLYNFVGTITYIFGLITVYILFILGKNVKKRTEYGNKLQGKIKGFKNFLKTAEKDKLEALVEQHPNYFFDILPYTYVLGISQKWIKKFETITLEAPMWYYSPNGFNVSEFGSFVNSAMKSTGSAMTSSPSSSGGSSSGGGSSGGGSGGGGGGSW